jgi:hypothetical protein
MPTGVSRAGGAREMIFIAARVESRAGKVAIFRGGLSGKCRALASAGRFSARAPSARRPTVAAAPQDDVSQFAD